MKALLGAFPLLNRQTAKLEEAQLYQGLDASNFADIATKWRPAYEEILKKNPSDADLKAVDAKDWHWDWEQFYNYGMSTNPMAHAYYAVESAGVTQGLMWLLKAGRTGRHPDHPGLPIFYVERVSTAPWNRRRFTPRPMYRGVGHLLVGTAIDQSYDDELDGRIALHALPNVEPFYRDAVGMTDLGTDDAHQGLRYFELTALQAARYLLLTEQGGAK